VDEGLPLDRFTAICRLIPPYICVAIFTYCGTFTLDEILRLNGY
jgi:hypothetical protein